jgi:voltage-gated potassium channel
MHEGVKQRVWEVLDGDDPGPIGTAVNAVIFGLIVANFVVFVLETVDPLNERFGSLFDAVVRFSIAVFTVEFVLRVWSSTATSAYSGPFTGRLRFLSRPYPLVDLAAILPFYLGAFTNLQFLRIVRLFWFLRLFRRGRYLESRRRFLEAYRRRKEDLLVASSGGIVVFVVSSISVYVVEHPVQPEAFSSIPETMWWSVVTLTTVGYGDTVPVTPLGRFLGALTALGGIALFAVPSSILAAGFIGQTDESSNGARARCPHCGERIDDAERTDEDET